MTLHRGPTPFLFILLLGLMGGCPKQAPQTEIEPQPPTTAHVAGEVLEELYQAIQAGSADQLAPLFTEDAFVFGLGPSDTWQGRRLLVERMRQLMLPIGLAGDVVKVVESRPVVGLVDGERSAWVFDLPKVKSVHKEKSELWLPRITAFLVREGDRYRIDALHVSLAVADQLLFASEARKQFLAPVDVADERSPHAEQVVGLVKRSLEDYGVKVDRTSEREQFIQLGTSAAEVFVGGKAFKALIGPQLGAIKEAGYSWKLDGHLRVKLAPGGKSAWAAAVVVQRMGQGQKKQLFPAFRFLWTLIEEGEVWNISSEHQSLAIREELREGANEEQLKAWKDTQGLIDKAAAKLRPAARK